MTGGLLGCVPPCRRRAKTCVPAVIGVALIAWTVVLLGLSLRPNARGRRLMRHHRYRVTLRLWITYQPTAGRARSVGFYGLHPPQKRRAS